MTGATDLTDENDAALAELRELGLAAAREAQARLLAADGAEEFAALSLAFGRISRSVRQTLALRAKLTRERERAAREAADAVRREAKTRVEGRKDQIRASVQRLIWREAENENARCDFNADLDEVLETEVLDAGFVAEPFEAQVARICAALGFAPPNVAPQGEAAQAGAAHAHARPAIQSPPPPRGDAPDGGASVGSDLLDDDYWRSSA